MRINKTVSYQGPLQPLFDRAIHLLIPQGFSVLEAKDASLTLAGPGRAPDKLDLSTCSRLRLDQRGGSFTLTADFGVDGMSWGLRLVYVLSGLMLLVPSVLAIKNDSSGVLAATLFLSTLVFLSTLAFRLLWGEKIEDPRPSELDQLLTTLTVCQPGEDAAIVRPALIALKSREERCAFCHEDFTNAPFLLCPGCRTQLHPDCWSELGGCPSLGCANTRKASRASYQAVKA